MADNSITYGYHKGYDSNNWMARGGTNRYNYGQESKTTFNKQAWDGFFNTTISNLKKNPYVGFITAPKVGSDSAFGQYLQLVTSFSSSNSLITEMTKNKAGNIEQILGSLGNGMFNYGPKLEYISPENGDGRRIFLTIADFNDNRRTQWKFTLSQASITATAIANNLPNPQTVTEIASDTTIIELTPDNNFFGDLTAGCLSCKKDSCGKGLRTLYFNHNFYKNGGYPQGNQQGNLQVESVLVLDAQIMPLTGNLRLEVQRGANGQTAVTQNGFEFITTAVPMQAGDFVFIGSITPTTSCIDFNLNCDMGQPKQYQYCVGMKTFVDCVGCIDQNIFLTRRTDELLSRKEQLALSMVSNLRTSMNRVFNDVILGQPIAYQNEVARQHPTLPIGNAYDGELIPEGLTGIIAQHDMLAQPLELKFRGCEPSCNEYSLKRILDAIENGAMDAPIDVSTPLTDGSWFLVGDTGALKGVIDQRRNDFMPTTLGDRNTQMAYDYKEGVSIFGSQNTGKVAELSNHFKKQADSMGIQIDEFKLGSHTIKGLHDRYLAYLEPGVIRLINMNDIHFFTDNLDDLTMDALGHNPFLEATAVKGKLIPNIVSKDLAPVWINGEVKNMVRDNCGYQFFSYMRFGVYLSPNNISKMLKIRIVGEIPNPAYNGGQNPLEPEYIKVPYWELGCGGCERNMRSIDDTFDTWNGFEPVNAQPYNFA